MDPQLDRTHSKPASAFRQLYVGSRSSTWEQTVSVLATRLPRGWMDTTCRPWEVVHDCVNKFLSAVGIAFVAGVASMSAYMSRGEVKGRPGGAARGRALPVRAIAG